MIKQTISVFFRCFIVVMSVLTLPSCSSKKVVTEYKEIIKIDTVYKNSVKEIVKAYHDTISVEAPCDSIGNLKTFRYVLKTPKAKVILSNVKGNINVKFDVDSIVDLRVNEFKSNYKSDIQTKETIKRIPNKYNLYSFGLNLLLLALLFRKKYLI